MVDEKQLEVQPFPKPPESSEITTEVIDKFVKNVRTRLDPLLGPAAAICTGTALSSLESGDFQAFFQYWLMSSVLMLLSDLGERYGKKKGINEGSPKRGPRIEL